AGAGAPGLGVAVQALHGARIGARRGAVPLAAVVLLPAAATLAPPIDLAVLADVHVVVAARHDRAPAARRADGGGAARATADPRRVDPVVPAHHRRAAPVAVDVAALHGARGGPGPGVVGLRPRARPVLAVGGRAARVRAGRRVVRGRPAGPAVGAIADHAPAVGARALVVPSARAVRVPV